MLERFVEPELLDSLPPDDPRAVRSRRDLRWINAWMGNPRHLVRALRGLVPPRSIVELGCGDGALMLKLARRLPWQAELVLLDMAPVVAPATLDALAKLGWKCRIVQARLADWIRAPQPPQCDLVVANLFLHHFSADELRALFATLARCTSRFISCEPRRWRPALWSVRFLRLLGCNAITRHDARISVRAGFRDQELSRLWPASTGFVLREAPAGFASHLFSAARPEEGSAAAGGLMPTLG